MDQLPGSSQDWPVSQAFSRMNSHRTNERRLSVPKTKYTADKAVNLPKKAIDNTKRVLAELFPELKVCPWVRGTEQVADLGLG